MTGPQKRSTALKVQFTDKDDGEDDVDDASKRMKARARADARNKPLADPRQARIASRGLFPPQAPLLPPLPDLSPGPALLPPLPVPAPAPPAEQPIEIVEDPWVCCERCNKWRRLPPGTPLPDDDEPWFW